MAVDTVARALAASALDSIQQTGGRYVGDTPLTAGNEQAELNQFVKNVTGGNPQKGDEVADRNTGNIWKYDGNTWKIYSFNPDHAQVQQNKNDIINLRQRVTKNEQDITKLNNDLTQEKIDRKTKDDDLQDQIDALQALAKGVREVVGTYADMEQLDKTMLVDGDIINVLADETRDGINAYYRFDHATQTYNFIGSISPYYTKVQIDTKEQALKDLIDKKQNKLIPFDNSIELIPDPNTGEVAIRAKLTGTTSDEPIEDGDLLFTNGGAWKLAPTINGQKVLENPTFFAPTTLGNEGQIITVNADGDLVWVDNGGGGTVNGLEINGIAQPIAPDTKIIALNTNDTLTENPDTNVLSVSKANIPITKDEYANLTQAEKEDETKVYLITDDVTDTPVVISNINDDDITAQSEDFTRSNKYLTEKFNNLKVTLNDTETVVNPTLKIYAPTETYVAGSIPVLGQDNIPRFSLDYLSGLKVNNTSHFGANDVPEIYVPTEAGTDGKAVIWSDADNKPVWGDASKVTLNGTVTTDASFYAPVTSAPLGKVLKSSGDNTAPVWSDSYIPQMTINNSVYSGANANPTFFAPFTNRPSAAKKYMISDGTNGTYAGIEIPSIDMYDGSCTAPKAGSWTRVGNNLKLYAGTPGYTTYFAVDSVSIQPKFSGTYELTMSCLHVRSSTSGWLSFAWGTSSGSTIFSRAWNTDNSGTRIPFICRCVLHCTGGVWYYPLFKNSGTSGDDSVSYVNITVNLLQLD